MLKRKPSPTGAGNSHRTRAGKGERMSAQTAKSGSRTSPPWAATAECGNAPVQSMRGDSRASWGEGGRGTATLASLALLAHAHFLEWLFVGSVDGYDHLGIAAEIARTILTTDSAVSSATLTPPRTCSVTGTTSMTSRPPLYSPGGGPETAARPSLSSSLVRRLRNIGTARSKVNRTWGLSASSSIGPVCPRPLRPPTIGSASCTGGEPRLAAADSSLEAADPLKEHVPLLHRTSRCVLRLAPPGGLEERPPFLVDRARVRRVVDGEPRAASLYSTDTARRIGWAWGSQRPGQHPPQGALVRRCRSHGSPAPKLGQDLHVPQGANGKRTMSAQLRGVHR
jgi:hypothetical protein